MSWLSTERSIFSWSGSSISSVIRHFPLLFIFLCQIPSLYSDWIFWLTLLGFPILFNFLQMLYTILRVYNILGNIIKHNIRTTMNERTHFFMKIYLSHIILDRVIFLLCVRDELETGTDCYFDPSSSRNHSSISSSSWLGLLNRGSLRA